MKKILAAVLITLMVGFAGCKTHQVSSCCSEKQSSSTVQDFGKKTYIWESWIFPDAK